MASKTFRLEFEALTAAAERGLQKLAGETESLTSHLEKNRRASLDVREASLRVEQAQQRAARAVSTYGADSLKAADAQVRLERQQQRLQGQLDKTSAHTHSLSGSLRTAVKAAVGFGAAFEGWHILKGAVEQTESLAKSTLVLKRNFGLSTEAASTWSAILKTNGIDQRSAMMSFTTLSKAIISGSKSSKAALQDLGISQADLKRQNFSQTLDQVVTSLTNMKGGAQRAADAQVLLGRGAKTLAPLFRNDGLGFQQQAKWAKEYGVTLDGHALKSSKELAVATTELKYAQMGMQIQLSEKVVPALVKVADVGATFVRQMRDGTGTGGKFAKTMTQIWQQLQPVRDALKAIGGFLKDHPRLLVAAAGAFVVWRVAAGLASAAAKARLIATFFGFGPKAAAGGAEAGTSFGTAASLSARARLLGLPWAGIGKFAAGALATAFIGWLITKIKGSKVTVTNVISNILNPLQGNDSNPGHLHTYKPVPGFTLNLNNGHPFLQPNGSNQNGRNIPPGKHAVGGFIPGPFGAGDIVPAMLTPGEVVLNQAQQAMVGRARILAALSATGAPLLGPGAHASTGGQVAADAARQAGFRGAGLVTAIAVADAESGFNAGSKNLKYPDHSIGLWQVNQLAWRGQFGSDNALMNPYTNARAAFAISGGGSNWQPWSTYTSGAYRSYLGVAAGLAGGSRGASVTVSRRNSRPGSLITHREGSIGPGDKKAKALPPMPTFVDTARHSDYESFYQAALTKAQVDTPKDFSDDLTVLKAWRGYEKQMYDGAMAAGDAQGIISYGGTLQNIDQQIDQIQNPNGTGSVGPNDSLLQGIHDQLYTMNQRAAAITGTQDGVLAQWVTQMLMGAVGTSVGLGAQLPSSPGVIARL